MRYIGIEAKIEEVLGIEFTALNGKKFYLDFLCLLDDDTLCHIEFQFPNAKPQDDERFFNYNILAQARHQKIADTIVVNFTSCKRKKQFIKIGKTKYFKPKEFYIGDIDFEDYIRNINMKVNSKMKLTSFEEITLLLECLVPEFENKLDILKRISEIIKNKELFDEKRYEFVKAIIELEIENFLTLDEQEKIEEGIKMTPKAVDVIKKAINEVNWKVLAETEQKGIDIGESNAMKKVAKEFREKIGLEELSVFTGLSIDEIKKL